MRTSRKTVTLSNQKKIRILDQAFKRMGVQYRWFRTDDVFEALELDRNILEITKMWPSEHRYERKDQMAYISGTALLLIPEKNQSSIMQRELILEMLRIER